MNLDRIDLLHTEAVPIRVNHIGPAEFKVNFHRNINKNDGVLMFRFY